MNPAGPDSAPPTVWRPRRSHRDAAKNRLPLFGTLRRDGGGDSATDRVPCPAVCQFLQRVPRQLLTANCSPVSGSCFAPVAARPPAPREFICGGFSCTEAGSLVNTESARLVFVGSLPPRSSVPRAVAEAEARSGGSWGGSLPVDGLSVWIGQVGVVNADVGLIAPEGGGGEVRMG